MVDRAIAATRIAAIRDAVARIRQVMPADAATFAADRSTREIVALNLVVAIQDMIDLAAHRIADAGLIVPGTHRDLFAKLADERVIPAELAARLAAASGMRNLIVHQYGTVDWLRLFDAASAELGDLEAYCAALAPTLGA